MPNLRLKVDLSDFFQDQRRLAYVWRNADWDHVEELEAHVQKIFDVPKVHFMTEDDVFLPSKESIKVVKDCSCLKAFRAKRLRNKFVTEEDTECSEDEAMATVQHKQKENPSISSSTPNGPIKKKRRTSMDLTIKAPNATASGKVAVTSTNHSSPDAEKSSLEETKDAEETVKTRKRKRKPKKKKISSPSSPRLSCVPVPITSSTLRPSLNGCTPNAKHVHFNEDDATLVTKEEEVQARRVVFKCHLAEADPLVAREIAAEEASRKKPEIVIHENIVLIPAKDSSMEDCENSSVIEIDDSVIKAEEEATYVKPDISTSTTAVEKVLFEGEGTSKSSESTLFAMPRLFGESTEGEQK